MKDSTEKLIAAFAEAASRYGMARSERGPLAATEESRLLDATYRAIVAHGLPARRELLSLMQHPDLDVALAAATHSLRFSPDASVATLERLSEQPGAIGTTARASLYQWRSGRWPQEEPAVDPRATRPTAQEQAAARGLGRDLKELCENLRKRIPMSEVLEPQRFDERLAIIEAVFRNIVGISPGSIEWLPNASPPPQDEALGMVWLLRPDLGEEIAAATSNDWFRRRVAEYNAEGKALSIERGE